MTATRLRRSLFPLLNRYDDGGKGLANFEEHQTCGGGKRAGNTSRERRDDGLQGPVVSAANGTVSRIPGWLKPLVAWMITNWPGRIIVRTTRSTVQLELFDRAMAIAAQIFTSVLPILIMTTSWVSRENAEEFFNSLGLPPESQAVLEESLSQSSPDAFGVVGALFVLVSATSLSRALTRAMATIWQLPRVRAPLTSAWRWLAVVLALALSVVAVRGIARFTDPIPPNDFWTIVVTFGVDAGVAIFVPWLLLTGTISARQLLVGGLLFAVSMAFIRPASTALLPLALEQSADKYGTIGVAFTYLTWLYVVSFVLLATAIVGQAITVDDSWLGKWLSAKKPTLLTAAADLGEEPELSGQSLAGSEKQTQQ